VQTKTSPTAYSAIRDTTAVALIRAFGMAMGFVTTLCLARWLGIDGFGVYSYAMACVAVATTLGIAGIERLLVRNLSVYIVDGSPELYRGQFNWAMRTGLALSTVAGLTAAVIVAGRVPADWRLVSATSTVAIVVLTVVIRMLQVPPRTAGLMVKSLLPENVVLAGLELCGLAAVAWICAWHLAVHAVLLVYAASALLAACWASTYLKSAMPVVGGPNDDRSVEWRRSAWALSLVVGGGMLIDQVDIVVLGLMRSAHDVSLYAAADKGAAVVGAPLAAAQLALSPALARMWASKDIPGLAVALRRGGVMTTVAGVVIIALLLVPGPWFLQLFGDAYRSSYGILAVLCIGQFVNVATGVVGSVLIMSNHERTVADINGMCLLLNIVLAIPCVYAWGAIGAAMATSIVMVVRNIALASSVRRLLGLEGSIFALRPGASK